MLGKNPFYFALTRKYIVLFGTLFNDLSIVRDYATSDTQTVKVPLTYASQDKMLARLFGDPNLDRKVAAITPAMSFEALTPKYDATRKLQTGLTRCFTDADGDRVHQYLPVPYNLEFKLYIYSREEEDGLRVLEQILPFFTPTFTVKAMIEPALNYSVSVPISLDDVQFDNQSYGDFHDRRKLIWTLTFTMRAEFLGPIIGGDEGKIIRIVHVNLRDFKNRDILEEVHVEPGLTANGEPTSVRADSIDVNLIDPDDDYGYIVEINEGPTPHP